MDLTLQPPRRPSNATMAGLVGLARMTDKARGHNAELLGEFVYGEDSGLDMEVLAFIKMTADEFAEAADELDDDALAALAARNLTGWAVPSGEWDADAARTEADASKRRAAEQET